MLLPLLLLLLQIWVAEARQQPPAHPAHPAHPAPPLSAPGLVVLSDQMVLEMLAGLPETEFLLASATR